MVHTHPTPTSSRLPPTYVDCIGLLFNDSEKSMVVAETNPNDRKLLGYHVVRKTKKTPRIGILPFTKLVFDEGLNVLTFGLYKGDYFSSQRNPNEYPKRFDQFLNKYHLQYRFVPTDSKSHLKSTQRDTKGLEKRLSFVTISALALSVFFLSSNLTGKVIGGLSQNFSNWISAILFVMGLMGAFTYFKSKQKSHVVHEYIK